MPTLDLKWSSLLKLDEGSYLPNGKTSFDNVLQKLSPLPILTFNKHNSLPPVANLTNNLRS